MKEGYEALPWERVVALQVRNPSVGPEMLAKGPSAQQKAVIKQPEQHPQGVRLPPQ
jgi:hypothetical protein